MSIDGSLHGAESQLLQQ